MTEDRFKFRIPEFTDKGTFTEFQYIELGDEIFCSLYGDVGKPQQCTGLKDDNGRLIYEGDILKYAEFDWNDESFKDIETNQAVVIWGGEYDYPAFDLKGTDFDGTNGLSYLFGAGWHFEVIGNIYENADEI